MNPPTTADRMNFWMHCYARASFMQARMFIEKLLELDPPPNDILRRALTAAIIATYCRPFKQRKPVRLSDEVVPSAHRERHDALVEMRDKVVAHRDLDGPVTEWGFVSQLQVNVHAKGMKIDTLSPIILNDMAKRALPLIDALIDKMDAHANVFVRDHLQHAIPGDGSYVVSLDDAPQEWLIRNTP